MNPFRRRREKVFGPGRAVPLDRNAKARILVYARAWGAQHRRTANTLGAAAAARGAGRAPSQHHRQPQQPGRIPLKPAAMTASGWSFGWRRAKAGRTGRSISSLSS